MASSITRFDIEKFDEKNDFGLWQIKMRALMVQQGCDAALKTLPADMKAGKKTDLMKKGILNNGGVPATLNSRELKKRTEGTKEETGDGLHVRRRSDHSGKVHFGGSLQFKSKGGTGKLKCFVCHLKGHLKRDCPMKNSSRFVKKGKHDQDSDSSDNEGNAYFGEALVVVGNDEMTEVVMDSGVSYHVTLGVEKRIWFEVELQGDQGDREAEVIQVGANITVTGVPGKEGAEGNVAEKKKVKESMKANLGKLLKYKAWLTMRSSVRGFSIR
uniref:Zinc finger, CCHC-type n=1 Tax=Tanacetum cinerariifolium TaxID=118510 RepID=A0A6L2JDX9_TANCI|nr:zinc finger, CCHC-type [Tanacetum cinerariifolium]